MTYIYVDFSVRSGIDTSIPHIPEDDFQHCQVEPGSGAARRVSKYVALSKHVRTQCNALIVTHTFRDDYVPDCLLEYPDLFFYSNSNINTKTRPERFKLNLPKDRPLLPISKPVGCELHQALSPPLEHLRPPYRVLVSDGLLDNMPVVGVPLGLLDRYPTCP